MKRIRQLIYLSRDFRN